MATATRLSRRLRDAGWDCRLRSFANLRELAGWATSAEPDFARLVAIGGDATLSVAARLAVRSGTPFVPVPNGFGNVFARVFGHPARAREVVELLSTGQIRRVDVGVVGDELFLSHRSYGVLEQIQAEAERGRRQPRSRMLRHLWYYEVAWRLFFTLPVPQLGVEVDGARVSDDAMLVTVANVETYRGFLSLTPSASPIDGLFDVFVVPRTSKLGLGARLLRLVLRAPTRWRGVKLYRGRRVVVTVDGRRDELKTWRRALPLLVPPGSLEALTRRTIEEDAPVERAG
ncbi:MAG: hypothetical protein HYR51_04730 [Candidatus Rokubacteria bacterium]|nr:hypothetical protein [Candidatus Rokubacteria bacterium]